MAAPQLSLPTPPGLSPGAAGQATSQSSAAAIAPANDSNLVISGNLEKIRIDLLMQSLSASRLTGYVDLQRPTTINDPERGTIYFDQGIPVHCQNGTLKGEEAIVEIFTWKGGEFKAFEEKEPCLQRTINRRLDFLLLESNTISQYQSYLQEHKINAETVLTKVERKAGPESAAEPGPTNTDATEGLIDGDLQVRFCALLDNQNTIGDIARLLSLSKPAWTRLVYHMLRSGLARKHSGIYVGGQETLQQSRQAEAHGQDHIALTLRNKTTGFYTHDYFKVLLQQELNRYIVHHRPFAVLLLHVRKEPGPKIEVKTVAERMDEITQLLRPSDYFCHFEGSSFAVILPETDATEARGLVKQILRFLADADANIAASLKVHANNEGGNDKSDNEKSANNKGHLWLKIGAAGVPDDSENLEALLKMAQHPDNSTVLRLH